MDSPINAASQPRGLKYRIVPEHAPAEIQKLADAADGWLSPAEGALLYRLARECRAGCIVEIGSWQGKSTTFLGSGSLAGGRMPVYAIDPHLEPPGPELRSLAFLRQMERAQLTSIVHPVVASSAAAAPIFNEPIGLLFIDGAHDPESIRQDWDLWVPKVIEGGCVALHDTLLYPGPRRIAESRILRSDAFVDPGLADSITYGRLRLPEEARVSSLHRLRMLVLKRASDAAAGLRLPPAVKRLGSRVLRGLQG